MPDWRLLARCLVEATFIVAPAGIAWFFFVVSVAACAQGLHPTSQQKINDAARTSAAAYKYIDAGPARILMYSTHCSIQGVIRDERLPQVDSGIVCP